MTSLSRYIVAGLAAVTAVMAAAAAYIAFVGGTPQPAEPWGLKIEQPDRRVGSIPAGSAIALRYRVINPTPRTLRIVGFSGG